MYIRLFSFYGVELRLYDKEDKLAVRLISRDEQ